MASAIGAEREDLVLFRGCHEHCPQQPVSLRGDRHRHPAVKAAPLRSAAARSAPRSGLRPRSRGRANSMHQAD